MHATSETMKCKQKKCYFFSFAKGGYEDGIFKNILFPTCSYVFLVSNWFILMFLTFPMCFPRVIPIAPHLIPYLLLKVLPFSLI